MTNQLQTQVFIYGLTDPHSGDIRYVGGTRDINRRNSQPPGKWLYSGRNDAKNTWIRSLVRAGKRPGIMQLEVTTKDKWLIRRRVWIEKLIKMGLKLLNADKRNRCRKASILCWASPIFRQKAKDGRDAYNKRVINSIGEKLKAIPELQPTC